MAKPKLALIPAAQGSKLFSVLPSSGVGDFDFSRSGKATRINSQGLIEEVSNGVSRLNYPMIDGVVSGCPHHILEPQRTNSIANSNFQSGWSILSGGSFIYNQSISPDGTLNAVTLTGNGSNSNAPYIGVSVVSGTSYAFSVFVKPILATSFQMIGFSAEAGGTVKFDLSNGTVSVESNDDLSGAKIEDYGSGWYRCSVIATADGTGTALFGFNSELNINGNNFYIYGAQVEVGSYLTSYIPTNGSAVTRSAEVATGSGDAATFNDSEGVLMAEISALYEDGNNRYISLSDGTSNNRLIIRYVSGGNNFIGMFVKVGGATQASINYNKDITINSKVVLKYKLNDYALWIDGFEVGTDTSANVPSANTLNQLKFEDASGGANFYGNTKQVQYYNSALTDSELEQLTSWTSFSDMAEGQLYTIE
jgi:hypothetical protein